MGRSLESSERLGWSMYLTERERREARRLLPAIEAMLKPATAEEFAVAMDPLLEFIEVFRLPDAEQVRATTIYRRALGELPADLLVLAIERTEKRHKYHVIPKPGEIMGYVSEEMEQRKRRLRLARAAAK